MASPAGGTWVPAIDIRETEDSYLIEADVAGLKKDDIELTVEDNVLTLKGERKHESEEKKEGYRRIERRYGSFRRSFELPAGVDTGKVKADVKDGVLSVTLPKPEEVKPKQIEVNYN
jgi:HSP20 family protein